jgi:hypothetical protein
MKYGSLIAVFALGCGGTAGFTNISDSPRKGVTDKPTEWQIALRQAEEIEVKQDETILILKDNTASLTAIKTKIELLEASLAKSEPQNGKDGDPASAPNPPAKANTALAPLKVATPGDFSHIASDGTVLRWKIEGNWNPTILETSAHLREHGINTDGMTHQQMADLHASIHEGKPVAMKSETVRYVSRGTNCPNGQCPTSSTRYVRRSRR